MHVEAVDLTDLIVLRGRPAVNEAGNLSAHFGDQQRSTMCRIADESCPHVTAAVHRRRELGDGEQIAVTHPPGLSVCLADARGVTGNGSTDDRHS